MKLQNKKTAGFNNKISGEEMSREIKFRIYDKGE